MIIVYDVNVKRVNKICQFLRKYLHWVQNSVFEGEITSGNLERIKIGLKEIINENEDSVSFYILPNDKPLKKYHIGVKKVEISNII